MNINPCTRCDGPTLFGASGETFCRYCHRPEIQMENAACRFGEGSCNSELLQIVSAFRQQGGLKALRAASFWRRWLPYGIVLAVLAAVLFDMAGLVPSTVLPIALFGGMFALLLAGEV